MRKSIICACTSALILGVLAVSAFAATICIKPDGTGDYPTIQEGINAAANGDIVLLAAGTYTGVGNREIDFLGKAVTVTSESGRDVTIIDCQALGRGFVFNSGETSASVLSGMTIRNGFIQDSGGGGILCTSSPTISDNTIIGNSASGYGYGGGIYCGHGCPTISNNIISGNYAYFYGGGIYCDFSSSAAIANNVITDNSVTWRGGGIFCDLASDPTISDNTISDNSASGSDGGGGGIYCYSSSATISDNTIIGNAALNGWGGGICCEGVSPTGMSPTISDNTIVGNSASTGRGGGICCKGSGPSIENTIISFSSQGEGIYCYASNPTLTNCDIYGNAGGDALCGTDGGGNISADPLFCDAGAGNFTLNCTSPCVNNPGYGQIGAFGVGCGPTAVEYTTWGRLKAMFR